jgi:hypothetical protein
MPTPSIRREVPCFAAGVILAIVSALAPQCALASAPAAFAQTSVSLGHPFAVAHTPLSASEVGVVLAQAPAPDAASQPGADEASDGRADAAPAAPTPGADDPAREASEAGEDKVIREQSIYIPYEKLRKVFEKEGRGVFLPYERFRELWKAARDKTRPPAEPEPPVGALITEVNNEATAEKDVVRVRAEVKIEVLAEGWNEVPLHLADAAITKATLDGQPARIVPQNDAGYKLLVHKEGDQPKQVELSLEYAKAITRAPGQNSVSFQAPRAPVSRWQVRIPEPGVKVDLHPLIAATEVPVSPKEGDEPAAPAPGPDETVVLAFVGAAPTVRIEWTPKAEGATGLEALASVQAEQQVTVSEGVTRTRAELAYAISRAELGVLNIEVPAGQKVVNVFDPNVRQWTVDQSGNTQQITVQLFEPAKGSQSVVVELEQFARGEGNEQRPQAGEENQGDEAKQAEKVETPGEPAGGPAGELRVPVVEAVGVGRQQGVVVVRVAEGLRAEASQVSGLLQVDAAELPPALKRGNWTFSYRYAAVPFDLRFRLEKVQPRIVADSLVEAQLEPKRLALDMLTVYTIERAGVFRLDLDVPPLYEVRDVRGRKAAGASPVQVDTHHREGDDNTRLVVNLARKAIGRVALFVRLEKDLDEPALLTPAGKSDVPLAIPQVVPDSVSRASGRLVVYATENLLVNPVEDEPEGFRSITTGAALEGMEPAPGRDRSQVHPVKAYAFVQKRGELVLRAERRKPLVRVRQLLVARIEHGSVHFEATFFYNVLYSSVNSLRIDVPKDVAAELRNTTESMQEKEMVPVPDDVPEGYVAWSFAGEAELIGEQKVELEWKQQLDEEVGSGKPVEVVIPHLIPAGVDLPWGQIVLTKAETIDLRESGETVGLRPVDPQQDLMPGADVPGAAAAYEFHDDWSLTIAATRYELEEVQQTSIERAVLRMVVTRADKITIQALYRMRSALQRLAVRIPTGGQFDVEPRINGRRVPLEIEQGRQDEYLIPLVGQEADESFLLELRYTVPCKGRTFRLDRPLFPLQAQAGGEPEGDHGPQAGSASAGLSEPAMQQMYLCVYIPEKLDLVKKEGPWTEHFRWGLSDTLDFRPVARPNDRQLLDWVAPKQNPGESFPTDGRLYVFSALRPAPPPDGSLRLVTVDADWLSLCVIGAVVLVGLVLVPCRAGKRVLVVGAFVVASVICGVFYPILMWQVCDRPTAAACLVVLVVWAVWYLVWTRPRAIARRGARPSDQPPPGPQPATPGPRSPFAGPGSPQGPQPPAPGSPALRPPAQPSAPQAPSPQPPPRESSGPPPRPSVTREGGAAGERERAIPLDASGMEEPSDVIVIDESSEGAPPADGASSGPPSEDDPSKPRRGEGGQNDA